MRNSKKDVRLLAMGFKNLYIYLFTFSPYNGLWSKTMIGYGSEDDNFVIELTYNYEIGSYRSGNDFFVSIKILV